MNKEVARQWDTCLQNIRAELPANVYDTWFAELKFVSFRDDALVISVPARMVSDFITQHHRDLVQRNLVQTFGPKIRLIWHDEVYQELEKLLLSDQLDLFFCNKQNNHEALEYVPLYEDEILFIVKEDKVREAADFIRGCMEAKPFEDFDIPLKVELSMGNNYGEMKELED